MSASGAPGRLTLCATCLFGVEGPLASELRRLGMEDVEASDGRVRFRTDERGLARANICSRFAERVLLELGRFGARSFDELFEGVRVLPLEDWIPENAAFPVKGYSVDSALHSVVDCQRIVKKAAAVRLAAARGASGMLRESGAVHQLRFAIMRDEASIYLDTSGPSLHKRGYRPGRLAAPLRETIAAAMVDLSRYRGRGDFRDPFCGSGTIAIEAAFAALNRAPGARRRFAAEDWPVLDQRIWRAEREAAAAREYRGDYRIFASDIDPAAVELARENARRAGVEDYIEFSVADALDRSPAGGSGVIVTNPPYGERLLEREEAGRLYARLGEAWGAAPGWKLHLLSGHPDFERCFGRRAEKRRKLYNGPIICYLYSYSL